MTMQDGGQAGSPGRLRGMSAESSRRCRNGSTKVQRKASARKAVRAKGQEIGCQMLPSWIGCLGLHLFLGLAMWNLMHWDLKMFLALFMAGKNPINKFNYSVITIIAIARDCLWYLGHITTCFI